MTHAVRKDISATELRELAETEVDDKVKQRLLAIAFVLEGASRQEAATRTSMARKVLAEWIKRYQSKSIAGLRDKPKPSVPRKERLAEVYPDMAPWFAESNVVSFESLPQKSNIPRFWKCRRCAVAGRGVKTYERKVSDQIRTWRSGGGCFDCKGEAISQSHLARSLENAPSLEQSHPALLGEFARDNSLRPHELTAGSKKAVKWRCSKCSHTWSATPYTRAVLDCGCQRCSTTFSKIEARFYAEFAVHFADTQWQFTDGGTLPEIDIFIPSLRLGIEVDGFRHQDRHEQDRRKNDTLTEAGIDLIRVRQDVLSPIEPCMTIDFGLNNRVIFSRFLEWASENVLSLREFALSWLQQAEFHAEEHFQQLCVSSSYPPEGESLIDHHAWVADVWSPENSRGPDAYHKKSHHVVKWICATNRDHLYDASIADRARSGRSGCPFCKGPRISFERSLAALKPSVANQWDKWKNGKDASEVAASSDKKGWFICIEEHPYEARIASTKENANNCKVCRSEAKKDKSLARLFPFLLQDWDYPKNEAIGLDPQIVSAVAQSGNAYWKCCKCNHEWEAQVQSRTRAQTRCPNVECRFSHWTDKPARAGPNTPNRSKARLMD